MENNMPLTWIVSEEESHLNIIFMVHCKIGEGRDAELYTAATLKARKDNSERVEMMRSMAKLIAAAPEMYDALNSLTHDFTPEDVSPVSREKTLNALHTTITGVPRKFGKSEPLDLTNAFTLLSDA